MRAAAGAAHWPWAGAWFRGTSLRRVVLLDETVEVLAAVGARDGGSDWWRWCCCCWMGA